ncbi:hypothetical protein [Undibacterium sp. Xuan67W]|uniref:hypothetical protein n=1 Tax=Undibacterium sp. Xuan67W TaxID=3413057 RepID=UPI003BF034A4
MRESFSSFASQATPTSPLHPLETSMHMAAAHLHATLPGHDLKKGLKHGYSQFKSGGSLKLEENKEILATNIHERREQSKSNWWDTAEYLPKESRARISMPSPEREPMSHGGGYIPTTSTRRALFDTTDGSRVMPDEAEQRKLGRKLLQPLFEPSWTPNSRKKSEIPPPYHGGSITEVRDLFTQQDPHKGEIGKSATENYRKRQRPSDDEVRVKAVTSDVFFRTKKKESGTGLHEVGPTDTADKISKLPDESRMPMAFGQADVRTNTALTFFRAIKKS